MSVRATPDSSQASSEYETYYSDDRSDAWVIFSGILILLLGTLNFIDGLAAIGNAHFYVAGARYVVGDLNTWGWVALCIGVAQWAVGLGIFIRNQFARWTGVAILSLNAIAQLLMMPAYPFWSLAIFALDIIGIYGLTAHGNRIGSRS